MPRTMSRRISHYELWRASKMSHRLILHPERKHLIYPLGSTIVIQDIANLVSFASHQAHNESRLGICG